MATSIYIFENDDLFHKVYKDVIEDPLYVMKIIDLYVKRREFMDSNKLK